MVWLVSPSFFHRLMTAFAAIKIAGAFVPTRREHSFLGTRPKSMELRVSELHLPGYAKSKIPFILKDEISLMILIATVL